MKLLLPVLTASLLAACSTYDGPTRFDLAGKMAPLVKNKSNILITEVPDAGNTLSNGMLLMMQGGGGAASNAAIGITNILSKPGLELGISGPARLPGTKRCHALPFCLAAKRRRTKSHRRAERHHHPRTATLSTKKPRLSGVFLFP